MAESEYEKLERAVKDLRHSIEKTSIMDSGLQSQLASKVETSERLIEAIKAADVFTDKQMTEFSRLSEAAIREQIRAIARGSVVSATINCTVTGTATVSVD